MKKWLVIGLAIMMLMVGTAQTVSAFADMAPVIKFIQDNGTTMDAGDPKLCMKVIKLTNQVSTNQELRIYYVILCVIGDDHQLTPIRFYIMVELWTFKTNTKIVDQCILADDNLDGTVDGSSRILAEILDNEVLSNEPQELSPQEAQLLFNKMIVALKKVGNIGDSV